MNIESLAGKESILFLETADDHSCEEVHIK